MTRTLRLFFSANALALLAVLILQFTLIHSRSDRLELWLFTGAPAVCYLLLALGSLFSKAVGKAPSRAWLIAVLIVGASASLGLMTNLGSEDATYLVTSLALVLSYCVAILFLLRQLTQEKNRPARKFSAAVLLVGAAAVIASLFLRITLSEGTGLAVVGTDAPWVTNVVNVGHGVFGPRIPWLAPIFGPTGYLFYLLSLAAALATVALAIKSRLSPARMLQSRIVGPLSGLISLANVWILADIFWGWHFDLSEHNWAATLGALCWFAALVFGISILLTVLKRGWDSELTHASVLFQFPLAVMNAALLPFYFQPGDIRMPGLALLIVGLQLQSCAFAQITNRPKNAAEPAIAGAKELSRSAAEGSR